MEHLLAPKYNLNTATISKLPPRINLYGGINVDINKTMSINPSLIVRAQSGNTEIMAQAVAGMKLDAKKDITVKAGLGYRLGDAAQFLLGLDYGDIRVGGAFDYTLSQLRNASNQNGFEIAVGYIGKIFKSVKPNKVILCPRYWYNRVLKRLKQTHYCHFETTNNAESVNKRDNDSFSFRAQTYKVFLHRFFRCAQNDKTTQR